MNMTYNLSFFFGPGFPRALLAASVVCPSDLLVPAFAPEVFFLGPSVASGTGVALFSEASSLGEDAGAAAAVWAVEVLEGVDFGLEIFRGVGFGRKRLRVVVGSLNTTILLGLLDLSGRPLF